MGYGVVALLSAPPSKPVFAACRIRTDRLQSGLGDRYPWPKSPRLPHYALVRSSGGVQRSVAARPGFCRGVGISFVPSHNRKILASFARRLCVWVLKLRNRRNGQPSLIRSDFPNTVDGVAGAVGNGAKDQQLPVHRAARAFAWLRIPHFHGAVRYHDLVGVSAIVLALLILRPDGKLAVWH